MRVATLQFSPALGAVEHNIQRANALLDASKPSRLDLLVLPEMAFSGYNFPNLEAIKPFLEPTTSGPTTRWAIETATRANCYVIVGYPEIHTAADGTTTNYNSTVTVSPIGEVINNYRKSFLYYTDQTWAAEGFTSHPDQKPFFCGSLGELGNVGHGICMDINPYRFEVPWQAYEFANSMLTGKAKLVVLSMAWLTRLLSAELEIEPDKPDMETVAYWLERFFPLIDSMSSEGIVVVFANRCGVEGNTVGSVHVENGEAVEEGDRVCYAGSSCAMKFQDGNVRMFEKRANEVAVMGKGEEGLLVVDTDKVGLYPLSYQWIKLTTSSLHDSCSRTSRYDHANWKGCCDILQARRWAYDRHRGMRPDEARVTVDWIGFLEMFACMQRFSHSLCYFQLYEAVLKHSHLSSNAMVFVLLKLGHAHLISCCNTSSHSLRLLHRPFVSWRVVQMPMRVLRQCLLLALYLRGQCQPVLRQRRVSIMLPRHAYRPAEVCRT